MTPAPARPDQTGDDAAVFASALRRLFALAGSPTVRTVAEAVGVSAATVSNWRTGRHLPAEFETIEPMLVWLTAHATTESAAGDDVVTVRQWQHLFTTATGRDPALPSSPRSRPPPSIGRPTQTPQSPPAWKTLDVSF